MVLNPERIASTPRTKGDSLRLCWSQSHCFPCQWWYLGNALEVSLLSEQHIDVKLGVFTIHWFRIEGGNLHPIMIILRTGKSSIILGLSKILKLASIDHPLRAIAINWLNVINIWLWTFANHHKLLALISILDFIMTLWVI